MSLPTKRDCNVCGRPIKNKKSLARGIGPVCWRRMLKLDEKHQAELKK